MPLEPVGRTLGAKRDHAAARAPEGAPLNDDRRVPQLDPIIFEVFVDLLRERIGMADALEVSELHQFNKLMSEYVDVVPDGWWQDAFDELDAQGTCTPSQAAASEWRAGCPSLG
jgi:hypothetical protein